MDLCINKEWSPIVIDLQARCGSNKGFMFNIDLKSSDITLKTQATQ
jgi:hypothetical protein